LNQIEYIPGNGQVVHHIVFYYDPSSQSQLLDNLDPGPGFQSFGVGPISGQAEWIGAWAPGQGITELPVNMGIKIPAGADYVMEVHYAPGYSGSQDQSSINLKFTPAAGVREAYTKPILDYQNDITDGPLFIPKNTVQTFHQEDGVGGTDISLIGLFPHMHRIGKSYKIFSVDTANDTLPLIEIPEWDFHWQGYYTVQQLLKIPKNSTLYGIATYDNTVNNPDNPSSPPQDVSAGENTTDEMMICFFTYTNYQAGDENIILDSTLLNTSLPPSIHSTLKVYPNPTTDIVTVVFQNSMPFTLRLLDLQGKLIEEKTNNTPIQMLDIRSFEAGIYLLEVQTEAGVATYKIWKK
jgi:hypothetical protein